MFQKIFIKSVLIVISTACVARAEIVRTKSIELPTYHEGEDGNFRQDPGVINGPQDRRNAYDPNPYESNPYEPIHRHDNYPRPPSYGQSEVKTVYVGRSVTNERLPLLQLAGFSRYDDGAEILSVRANTQPNSSSRTIVQLIADGRIVAQQVNPGYQINLVANQRLILGQTIRSLQLVVNGSTIIRDIQIEVLQAGQDNGDNNPYPPPGYVPGPGPIMPPPYENPPGYGQQRLDININRATYGNDQVDLSQYIDLGRYQGMTITQVIVSGSSQYEASVVDLLINGFNEGQVQFQGGYQQQQSFWLQDRTVIGQGADSVMLYTRGNMTIGRVTLVLSN